MFLTILTPTYNRANRLFSLFDSLESQSIKDFEWLVVDDGSSDNTQNLISTFAKKSSFPIRYIKKENGGKHTALNTGIRLINSELTFIVDSDDYLVPYAVEFCLKYHLLYRKKSGICGYSYLRLFPNGKVNGRMFAKDEWIASFD